MAAVWFNLELSMASISSAGIGSGLDVSSIITQLVALEKQPLKALQTKATTISDQGAAMTEISNLFSTLGTVATRLTDDSAWTARKASSSNTSAATITSTNTAPATSFSLDVVALAKKQTISAVPFSTNELVGAGTLTFRLGTWTGPSADAGTDNANTSAALAAVTSTALALSNANADVSAKLLTKNSTALLANAALADDAAALSAINADNAYVAADLAYTAANTAANNALTAITTTSSTYTTAVTDHANALIALAADPSSTTLQAAALLAGDVRSTALAAKLAAAAVDTGALTATAADKLGTKNTLQTPADATDAAALTATANLTDASALSATASDAAAAWTTATGVASAAQAAATAATNAVSGATPTFVAAPGSSDVSVSVLATDDLETLKNNINNTANIGVVASIVTDSSGKRLQLVSKDTGAVAGFRVSVTDADGDVATGLSRLGYDPQTTVTGMAGSGIAAQYGQDAKVRVDGLLLNYTSNTIADIKEGVTVDLKAVTTSSVSMAVSEDVTVAVKNVDEFMSAYNKLSTKLADLTKYDVATKTGSIFQGDSTILGLQSVLRSIGSSISAGSSYQRLSDVGIERGLNGELSNTSKLGSPKFITASANNTAELRKLFTDKSSGNESTYGFAWKFKKLSADVLAAGGTVKNKNSALTTLSDKNAKEQTKVNDRATATEARLRKTYTALDTKMASLTALNSYVAQQVTTWNKSTN
jgi:flagellar hook-associated protein 2